MTTPGGVLTRWRGWLVPGVPFLLSWGLSTSTVSSEPFWQDSGAYLTAVRELGVLYPPGFVLYLLLCKAWTAMLFFVDFTLAVHLFSSFCASLAAATMSVAVRDVLRSRGRLFRVLEEDPGALADAAGAATGCLLAGGYTFWFAAIYAKGYALYYLVLAALLWRMIRADESRRPRDFTVVAVLMGLAWQVHPSAVLVGGALALFVVYHGKSIGWKGIAWRLLVAAACALGPSLVVLPLLVGGDPWFALGDPRTPLEVLNYLSGRRFTSLPGVWGWETSRAASFGLFFWEEMLGVGLVATAVGLSALARRNARLLIGVAAWTVPYALVTILFKIEGQHDCWFVAAWLPLYLAVGVGVFQAARWFGRRGVLLAGGMAAVTTAWSAGVNRPDLTQRGYVLPDMLARVYLDNLDADAIVVLGGDDPNSLCAYRQRVRGRRADVVVVNHQMLFGQVKETGRNWYEEKLVRRYPFLRMPDYWGAWSRFPTAPVDTAALVGFCRENVGRGRPIFSNLPLAADLVPEGFVMIPAGALWKIVPREEADRPELRYWEFPILPEEVLGRPRRERGQQVEFLSDGMRVSPAAYERRLLGVLLAARLRLVRVHVDRRDFSTALKLCESMLRLDPEYESSGEVMYFMAIASLGLGDEERARKLLLRADGLEHPPRRKASILCSLGEIHRNRGQSKDAEAKFKAALEVPGLDEDSKRKIEEALRRR